MLELIIEGQEMWDEAANFGAGAFVTTPSVVLTFEHSLLSLSKWEQIHEVPFLGEKPKSQEQTLSYILCMCLTKEVPSDIFSRFAQAHYQQIQDYVGRSMTATTFHNLPRTGRREVITAELIRYWMISLGIPIQFEERHLAELFTIIKVFDAKNSKQKKKPREQVLAEQRELNARRRAELGTTG